VKATLAFGLTERLKREIYSGRRKVGSRLPSERELSASLGVNRNAVREALKALEEGGLVETKRGSGTVVRDFAGRGGLENLAGVLAASAPELSRRTVLDALDFRVSYASGIAELCARNADEREQLELGLKLLAMKGEREPGAWAASERAFMSAVVEATHNRIFVLLQNTLAAAFKAQPEFEQLLFAHREKVERTYRELLDCCGKRDEAAAAASMRALMESERGWVSKRLTPFGGRSIRVNRQESGSNQKHR